MKRFILLLISLCLLTTLTSCKLKEFNYEDIDKYIKEELKLDSYTLDTFINIEFIKDKETTKKKEFIIPKDKITYQDFLK